MIILSPYSEIFYNEWKINPHRSDYNIVFDQELFGDVDSARINDAFKRLVQDYLLFHSHIKEDAGKYYWIEHNPDCFNIDYLDGTATERELLKYVQMPFSLDKSFLLRAVLVKFSPDHFRLIVVFHHIIKDGFKFSSFVEFISNYYNDKKYVCSVSLEIQRRKLIKLNQMLRDRLIAHDKSYQKFWGDYVQEASAVDLIFLKPFVGYPMEKNGLDENPVGEVQFCFSEEVFKKIKLLRVNYDLSPYLFGQAIFAVLLHRYSDQNHFSFAYPLSILEGIGFDCASNVNTNLISYEFNSNTTVLEVLQHAKKHIEQIKKNQAQYYPFPYILGVANNNNLLDVEFIQADMREAKFSFKGVDAVKIHRELNMELRGHLMFTQGFMDNRIIQYQVTFDKRLIDFGLLTTFIEAYKKLFIEALDDLLGDRGSIPVSQYDIVNKAQHDLMLQKNPRWHSFPQKKLIHQLFEEQVIKVPHNVALGYQNIELTYDELNKEANKLANFLIQELDVKSDEMVLLFLDKSQSTVIAILGVLKAGAAYVPIDSHTPEKNILYTFKDTKAKNIITNLKYKQKLKTIIDDQSVNIFAIDEPQFQGNLLRQKDTNPTTQTHSKNLAYVIYTSGTTGRPRGVMIEHKSFVALIVNFTHFPLNSNTPLNMLSTTNYVFDIFCLEYMLPLASGYKIQLVDLITLEKKISLNAIDCIQLTPSKLELLIEQLDVSAVDPVERTITILMGGEAINHSILKRIGELEKSLLPIKLQLINVYGPTETTIWSTAAFIDFHKNEQLAAIPIGRPLCNEEVYVLDKTHHLLPLGAVGELYIAGCGLARGYLNRPELTDSHFISNPFQREREEGTDRIYKTADLVRMLPNGGLEYIRRNDSQVKIRGYRIELGDIEMALASYPEVKQVVVIASDYVVGEAEDAVSDKNLVAYYVANRKLDESKLYNYLGVRLPEYMVPIFFVHLNKLPLTINDKLNKKLLPKPAFLKEMYYIHPNNQKEQLICEAFSQVLGIKKVGITDDFFRLGGNSIKAISLVSKLQRDFNLQVADVFNFKTPERLAENIIVQKDAFKERLEKIKWQYKNYSSEHFDHDQTEKAMADYLATFSSLPKSFHAKSIHHVLLTGATGYLGCNLLNKLLHQTNYTVYLLVRAHSPQGAFDRVNRKFQFYFDENLLPFYKHRLFVFVADLEKDNLGILSTEKNMLSKKIDSIIHAAALTKHYGAYDVFYSANVQATINLLEFCKLTKLKDFHYISTTSVFNELNRENKPFFVETDLMNATNEPSNIYIKTKLEGEKKVVEYRQQGINANIYRVGNLPFISSNYRAQENSEDNGFICELNFLLSIKLVAQEIATEELSPVDVTAEAIVKLFDKQEVANQVFHVFNPHLYNMLENNILGVKAVSMVEFIDTIFKYIDQPYYQKNIERFLLHKGWLDDKPKNLFLPNVLENRTSIILKRLGFVWDPISNDAFACFVNKGYSRKGLKVYGSEKK